MTTNEREDFINALIYLIDDINIVVQKLLVSDCLAGKKDYDDLFDARTFAMQTIVKLASGEE